jgi:cell division transport system permease protein
MAKGSQDLKRIIKLTKKHIKRNKWLSFASILVILFSFLISSIFVILGIGSSKGLDALEKQGQIIVFFELNTPEPEIRRVEDKFKQSGLIESITYISQEEAQKIYVQDFENDVELVESVTTGALPPSLELRAKDLSQLDEVLTLVTKEKDENKNINEIVYYKEFIDRLKAAVTFVRFGGIVLVTFLTFVSITLIFITIGFNIKAHSDEIKTMKLIGSTGTYIRTPYIVEGALYGFIGAIIACLILQTIWFGGILIIKQTDFYYLLTQMLRELSLLELVEFNGWVALLMLGIESVAGIIVGAVASMVAVIRYMKTDL